MMHLWVLETRNMCGIAENMRALVKNSIPRWKTSLPCKNQHLAEVTIKRGISQRGSFSPLLFVI